MTISHEEFSAIALALPQTSEHDHFGKPSFRVGTKIFATLWLDEHRAALKLSPSQQVELCEEYPGFLTPVPGTWGGKGWTNISLHRVQRDALAAVLSVAWCNVAPKKLLRNIDN